MYYQLDDKAILRDERVYLDSGLSTLYLAKNDEILFLDEKGCEIAIYLLEPRTYNDISTKYFSLKLAKDKKELDEFLFELKTKGFINIFEKINSHIKCIPQVIWDKKNFFIKPLSFPNSITLKITKKCNLYCKHCCENSGISIASNGELTFEEIAILFSKLNKYNLHLLRISGGELFTRPDIINILNETLKHRFAVGLVTNLVDLSEEYYEVISKLYNEKGPKGFGIGTSLDGAYESTHDMFRGKKGAFNSVLAAIQKLKSMGIRITIQTTIHKKNIDQLEDIVRLVLQHHIKKIVFFIPSNLGRGNTVAKDIINDYEACKHIMNKIIYMQNKYQADINIDFLCTHFSFYPSLNHNYSQEEKDDMAYLSLPKGCCNAGIIQCEIYEDGNVYPCSEGICKELIMGNVRTEDILDIWKKMSWNLFRGCIRDEDLRICNDCFAKNYCGMKFCRVYAMASTGDFYGNFKECAVVQKQYKYLLAQSTTNCERR